MTTLGHQSVIEQAKSVVAALLGCSLDAALAVLVVASQRESRNLRDTASAVVSRGAGAARPTPSVEWAEPAVRT